MSDKILAIDQGTTGTTCLVVSMGKEDKRGIRIVARGYREFPQHFPKTAWVEHDLDEIWQSTTQAITDALKDGGLKGSDIAAIGITNQRETTGLWDSSGTPVHRAIVWQDRRTAPMCQALRDKGLGESVRARTGLVIDPYFSGTKIAWLLDHVDNARARAARGELRFGTIDTWLVWRLTAGAAFVTDSTNASRTMLFDIHRNAWDDSLLEALGNIPKNLLPQVKSCSEIYGTTRGLSCLPDGIPIAGMAGDQHAALFGQACLQPGMAKCTYGTGAFALVNTGPKAVASHSGLLTTIAWRLGQDTTYALEGSVFIAGAVVQWLRDGLQFFKSSAEIEALAASVPDSGDVIFVPALTGLGAPHWRPEARGTLTGLTRGTTRAHIARAALEGIAFQVYDLLDAMRSDSGSPIEVLRADGGAAANDLLMQFQADLLQVDLHRPKVLETTAMGAAFFAALGAKIFPDVAALQKAWELERTFSPKMDKDAVQRKVQAWRHAVANA